MYDVKSLPSCEGSGLKRFSIYPPPKTLSSPFLRREWIETDPLIISHLVRNVSLLAKGVD